jgi:hypothetical protein
MEAFAQVTVVNSTLSGNRASGLGPSFNRGGAVYVHGGSLVLINSTLSGNLAVGAGGGIYTEEVVEALQTYTPRLSLSNTIIANNTGGDCVTGAPTTVLDEGHNLIEDAATACGLTDGMNGNVVGVDPLLGPLADNGGPTATLAVLADSAAIGGGDDAVCAALPVSRHDQRGFARPGVADVDCTIGAFEFGAAAQPPSAAPSLSAGGLAAALVLLTAVAGVGLRRRRAVELCRAAAAAPGWRG